MGRSYFKNAVLLTGSDVVLRLAGMGLRIYLANALGGEGMGMYQLVLAVYTVFVALASSGLNVASTRLAAQSLARAFGDGAERGRMKADLTLQEAMPPRGVAIISGEDTPGVGESGMARFYVVNVGKGDVPANESLTAMQELARLGYLQKSMRGYIVWLSKQVEKLPQMLHDAFIRSRAEALERTKGQHGRTAEARRFTIHARGSRCAPPRWPATGACAATVWTGTAAAWASAPIAPRWCITSFPWKNGQTLPCPLKTCAACAMRAIIKITPKRAADGRPKNRSNIKCA